MYVVITVGISKLLSYEPRECMYAHFLRSFCCYTCCNILAGVAKIALQSAGELGIVDDFSEIIYTL